MTESVLKPCATIEEMLKAPLGRYVCEGNLLYWCADPKLTGMAIWGRPSLADFGNTVVIFDRGDHRHISRDCDFILDLRGVETVDPSGVSLLESAFRDRITQLESRVARQIMVRPGGVVGAVMEGFFGLLGAKLRWASFTELAPALAWLNRSEMTQAIEELTSTVRQTGPVTARLTAWFLSNRFSSSLERAARALGLSPRSLQRTLRSRGSSFRQELDTARLAAAEERLHHTDLKLEVVAVELGFRSGAHFSTWFKAHNSMTPSEFRSHQRSRRPDKPT